MARCSSCGRNAVYFISGRWLCPFCAFEILGKTPPASVLIDVETTGINPCRDAIVQISAVRYQGDEKVDVMDTYINPLRKIPSEATMIHGITNDMVRSYPPIKEMRSRFMEVINDAILVGYNVLFDLRFLNMAFHGALTGSLYTDVLPMVKGKFKLPNYKLETVATHLGSCPEGGFHNSLADCEATAAVYFHLRQIGCLESVFEYRETEEYVRKRWADKSTPPSQIIPKEIPTDESHPFYGKRIVFTGELSIERDAAMQMAVDVGALVKSSVSGKTDFLVVGQQDITLVGDSGISTKEKTARELNDSGKGHIQILSEQEFMELVQQKTEAGVL